MTVLQLVLRRRLPLLAAAGLAALTYLAGSALLGLAAWLISRAAQHPEAAALTLAAVGVRALGLSRAVLRYAERVVGHSVTLRVVADLRVAVFDGLVRRGNEQTQSADVLSAAVVDVEAVQDLLLRCVLPFVAAALVLGASVAVCWLLLPVAGLVLLVGLGFALLAVPAVAGLVARGELQLAGQRSAYQTRVLEVVRGSADLLVLGGMPAALADVDAAGAALAEVERRGATRAALASGLLTALQGATVLAVAVVALDAVSAGSLSPVLLAVVVLVTLGAFEPVAPLAEAGGLLPRTVGAVSRLSALLTAPPVPVRSGTPGPGGWLEARGICASYPKAGRLALEDVDIQLAPGRVVAVVGPSGAGKSTLLKALSGQVLLEAGSVLLAGRPIESLSEGVRAGLVVVAEQEAHLFHTSVADNLRLARTHATDAQLQAALCSAGLEGWVDGLPHGLRSPVGERGGRLSGGERKRLVVARALLSPARVVLLDEPTEGLNAAAADALVRDLVATCGDRALLLVTHRLAALEGVDEVLVLDQGRVVQRGAPAELALVAGPYRDLYVQQVRELVG